MRASWAFGLNALKFSEMGMKHLGGLTVVRAAAGKQRLLVSSKELRAF